MSLTILGGQSGQLTASDDARINAVMRGFGFMRTGYDLYALTTREMLAAVMTSANAVTVATGDMILNGRHVAIDESTTLAVSSGQLGMIRHDLVVIELDTTGDVDKVTLSVVEGDAVPYDGSTDTAKDPRLVMDGVGTIIADVKGVWQVDIYRIVVANLGVRLERLFDYDISIGDMADWLDIDESDVVELPGFGQYVNAGTATFNQRFKLWDGARTTNIGGFSGTGVHYLKFCPSKSGTGGIISGIVSFDPSGTYSTDKAMMAVIPGFSLETCDASGPLDFPCVGISCVNANGTVWGNRWGRVGIHVFTDGTVGVYAYVFRDTTGHAFTFSRSYVFRTWINACSPRQYARWLAEQRGSSYAALSN